MADINSLTIEGRLTRDAELKHTNSGTALCKFGIAVNKYMGPGKDDKVSFFNCVMWGKRAEALFPYLKKGEKFFMLGSIEQDRWKGDDGSVKQSVEINIDQISFGPAKKGEGRSGGGYSKREESNRHPNESEDQGTFEDDIPF